MKILTLALFCIGLALISCSKSSDPASHQNLWLDTVRVYTISAAGTNSTVTHFVYDASDRLLQANAVVNDTTSAHVITTSTTAIVFSYNGADTIPSGYTDNVHHLLFYDAQGRLSLDSQDVGSGTKWVHHYSYGDGYIARFTGTTADTVFTDGKNKTGYIQYAASGTPDHVVSGALQYKEGYYYSIYTNPFYFGRLAAHLGYIFQPSFFDMASREICTSRQYILHVGDPNSNVNYVWVNNDRSQVISGVGTSEATGTASEFYQFIYRKS